MERRIPYVDVSKCVRYQEEIPSLLHHPLPRKTARPAPPFLSRRCRSRGKCLIEFQTRQLHRSVIGLSLSLSVADSVLKETDKNSESFTVHRSPAQARFDPTPAAAAAAAATPTATPYFNAERKIRKRNFRSGRSEGEICGRDHNLVTPMELAGQWRIGEERHLLDGTESPRFHFWQ